MYTAIFVIGFPFLAVMKQKMNFQFDECFDLRLKHLLDLDQGSQEEPVDYNSVKEDPSRMKTRDEEATTTEPDDHLAQFHLGHDHRGHR